MEAKVRGVFEDDEQDERGDRHGEIAGGAGEGGDDVVAPGVAEVADGDRAGFGPAEQWKVVDQRQQRHDDRAPGVDVLDGVESDAT